MLTPTINDTARMGYVGDEGGDGVCAGPSVDAGFIKDYREFTENADTATTAQAKVPHAMSAIVSCAGQSFSVE